MDAGIPFALIADLDLGPFLLRDFVRPRHRVAGQLEEWLSFALAQHDRFAAVAPDPDLRIEGQFGKKMDAHFFGGPPASAVAEHIDPLVAMRAVQKAHVLYDAQNRNLHLMEHED